MKKEEKKTSSGDNSFGVSAVVLGILSIVFASLTGLILGILAFIFAVKQQNKAPNVWGGRGKILAIVGMILSIIVFAFNIWLAQNPDYLLRLAGG